MTTKELLKKVKQIQIRTKRVVNDVLSGEYRSSFRGRGMEFEEVREYLPGDEIRTIDWNVTARTGVPYIKTFREERELVVMLVVDVSLSSEFGTVGRLKKDIANEISAILSLSAINNNDKVGLILFSDKIEKFVPPRKGKKNVLRVIRELLVAEESEQKKEKRGNIFNRISERMKQLRNRLKHNADRKKGIQTTNINNALDYLNRTITKKSVVFLISDFMDADYEEKIKLTNKKHDLVAIVIEDPIEKKLPKFNAIVELKDAESGKTIEIDLGSKKIRNQYEKIANNRIKARENIFKSNSIDAVYIDIGKPYISELVKFFKIRETRR
jgi:uncharacterized protein (DUF58 family)